MEAGESFEIVRQLSPRRRFLRQIWSWRKFAYIALIPLAFLPIIFIYDHDPELSPQMRCLYVLCVMMVYWLTECIPIAMTSLIPMVAFPLMQLERAVVLAPMYLDEINMVIIASFLVVRAFEEAQLHRYLAFRMMKATGVTAKWLSLGLMFIAWLLSLLLSNAMAATLLIPVVKEIIENLRDAMEKDAKTEIDRQKALVAHRASMAGPNAPRFTTVVSRGLPRKMVQRLLRRYEAMLVLAVAYSCSIGGTASLIGQAENLIVFDEINKIYAEYGCQAYNPMNFMTWFIWGLPGSIIFLPIGWFWLQMYFIGPRYTFGMAEVHNYVNENRLRLLQIINAAKVPSIKARQRIVLIHLAIMVALLFTRILSTNPTIGWEVIAPGYVRESTAACLIAISLFAFPISLAKPKKSSNSLKKPKRTIAWTEDHGGQAFNIVLLVGGGIAASKVAISSGLASSIAHRLYDHFANLDPMVTTIIIIVFNVILTELVTDAASVHFTLPIYAQVAHKQGVNPLLYILPTSLTGSFDFALPVATPTNLIATSLSKSIRYFEMITVGVVLDIIGICIVILATNTWGAAFFQLYVPAFVESANGTLCHSVWDGQYYPSDHPIEHIKLL